MGSRQIEGSSGGAASCHREDRGDGILVLAHADVAKALFVDRLPDTLAGAVAEHNKIHPAEEQMRLRLALHAGEITYDDHGVAGSAINHAFRLLEAKALKNAHSEASSVESCRPVGISNKETSAKAWVRLLGTVAGAVTDGRPRPRPRRRR